MSTSTPTGREPGRARVDRWRTSAEVLDAVRREPGLTRVELARRLALSSASVTETVTRLRTAGWLDEHRAPVHGRGRPTTSLVPCPDGPQVVAVDLRHEDWRVGLAGLDGEVGGVLGARHDGDPDQVAVALRDAVTRVAAGRRAVAVGLAAPAPVSADGLVEAGELAWDAVDLGAVTAGLGRVPLRVGNDATLAGVAEARTGAAAGAGTAVYLTVEVGLGGAMLLDGHPHLGARGAAGEYGHLPFGDPARRCACGASGCWGPEVDGRALARRLGDAPPADPRSCAEEVLARAAAGEHNAVAATRAVAACLARGIAGVVHVHDPDVIVLGGLARALRAAPGFDDAYVGGLMAFRRDRPVPVLDAVHGDDGALHGAAALALDHATSAEGLAALCGD
ncbi:ROK family transcriptional regulator [Actinomycetospora cinnamomea]|uniref:Putative NBD/HSP70 family sugar kinase n=1 Tax=Actinomycetospora cinnamomea TaxID=663609 RepID=A0A2U1FQU0_9PSEU|nr:ROK family transcriptional regulator [Actinomycetospora cinnamomea]PVZ14440.1 putative NBD/HSP70 family sugar kinase [Actinomycetospora cinnamomea]